jgi:hypothetical protein
MGSDIVRLTGALEPRSDVKSSAISASRGLSVSVVKASHPG